MTRAASRAWLLRSSSDVHLGGHRRAGNSGSVLEGRGHHRWAVLQQWDPFVGLAADPAAGDEQLRPDRVLDGYQHLCHLWCPALVAPVVLFLHRRGGPVLGLHPADLEMAE